MECTSNIKIATYNLHGINQGLSFLEYLCDTRDIIYVQEHWLAPFNLTQLDTICPNFQCFATSAMNDVVCNKLLVGRPFGGVAILVKQNLATDFKVVKLSTRYIILKAWSTLFINVYLPCISSTDWENEYMDCLACIANDVSEIDCRNIIMGGDFNVDFNSKHPLINVLCSFMTDFSLVNLDNKLPPGTNVSFRVDASGASSLVDHFFVSKSITDYVYDVEIMDNGINLSDHCAIIVELSLPVQKSPARNSHGNSYKSYRWDRGDLGKYYFATWEFLRSIAVPVHLLNVDCVNVITKNNIQLTIDCFYRNIVNALYHASNMSIPKVKRDFYKFWWDEELTALKQASLDSFNLWTAVGKPRFGSEFLAMKRAKFAYKLAIKNKECSNQNEFTNSLNDALLAKDMDSFWRSWRSKFCSNTRFTIIDGCSDDLDIANKFATMFQSACRPNSDSRHDDLKREFLSKFNTYRDHSSIQPCTVELVDSCIRRLKRGKAAGHDELTAEHLVHAHPILVVLLSLLFNMIILHGIVPLDFGKGIIVPLIKNLDGDKTSCDNYRGITLSPVLSKVFELVLMDDLQSYLQSDELQFGFKQNSSCAHAVFTLRSVVDHYCRTGSTVTICALDISKAFDRVDHYKLLSLLMDRKVPRYFIMTLLSWFQCCVSAVRWGGSLSSVFSVLAGVRQGGLLSPLLFSIYMDVLINRLRLAGLGCKMFQRFYGCLLYADDIILLSHSLNAMRSMLKICEQFALDLDVKFNATKSVVMRIGERFDVHCAPLILCGGKLQFVECFKYLGVHIVAGKRFSCSVKNVRMKFYRSFNSIYYRSKGASSELVSVQLFKSYCLPFILYATEAIPLTKSSVRLLDNCVKQAVVKIFKVYDADSIEFIRQQCDLPYIGTLVERRRLKFVNKLLDVPHLAGLLCTNL